MDRDALRLTTLVLLLLSGAAAHGQTARIVLRWKDVPGARGYEVQIARDSAFVEVVLQTRTPTAAYRWEQLPSVTHWWRVRSFDAESRPSEWSQPRTVVLDSTVPIPRAPVDEALVPCGANLELSFEPSPLVKEFQVELSQSKDFAPARQVSSKGPSVPVGQVAPGVWYWRARAVDVRERTSEFAQVRKFTVRAGAPKPKAVTDVVLGAPAVTLAWESVACAASFLVEAATETKERVSLPAQGTSLAFKPNAAGEYRWRVAAVDERGTPGEWSVESGFKVRLGTPTPKGESSTPLKLDLAWGPVVGASAYRVEIATEKDFKQVVSSGVVSSAQFRATDVPPGRVYWRVSARDDKGHSSLPSEPRVVDVVAPDPLADVEWVSPSADVVVARGDVVELAWKPVDKAIYFELELDGAVTQVLAPPRRLADLSDGAHVVRLRAKGNASRASAWSAPREIFVGVPAVVRAEVTLVGEVVQVVLKDEKGRAVRGVSPTFSVEKGAIEAPVEREEGFVARWSPPADGEDVLRIEERGFVTKLELERPLPPVVSIAARAGGLFNFTSVASPTATAGLTVRLPVLQRRLGLEARVGIYGAARSFELGPQTVQASATVVPFSLLVGWYQPLGAFLLRGGVGPAFQLAFLGVDGARETRVVGDLELAVGLGRKLGPGFLEVEISGLFGTLDGQLAKLATGGLGLRVGYALDLGGQ